MLSCGHRAHTAVQYTNIQYEHLCDRVSCAYPSGERQRATRLFTVISALDIFVHNSEEWTTVKCSKNEYIRSPGVFLWLGHPKRRAEKRNNVVAPTETDGHVAHELKFITLVFSSLWRFFVVVRCGSSLCHQDEDDVGRCLLHVHVLCIPVICVKWRFVHSKRANGMSFFSICNMICGIVCRAMVCLHLLHTHSISSSICPFWLNYAYTCC